MPDILAFSDTRVNENSPIRPLDGYHNFNFTPTPTGAGGVGFYLKDIFDYDLRPDLKLDLNLCEDIWFKVKNVDNSKLNGNGLIVGVIYRHGHNFANFCEKLSEKLLSLNAKKEKYFLSLTSFPDVLDLSFTASSLTDFLLPP